MNISIETINYAICVIGALLCLYSLISPKIDNNQVPVFMYFSISGLAWCGWIFSAKTNDAPLQYAFVVARAFMLISTILAIYVMQRCQARITREQGLLLKRRSTDR